MWFLEGWDRATEELVQEVPLARLDADAVRRVLKVDDDLPIEPFDFDVPDAGAARELASYSEESVVIDEALWYQLGFSAD